MANIKMTLELTGETPDEIRERFLDFVTKPLVESINGTITAAAVELTQSEDDVAAQKASVAWSRVGDNTKRFLAAAASFDDGYQTDELAKKVGVSPTTIRSSAANLGRTMKGVNEEFGDDSPLYYWDDKNGKWIMPKAVRQAILAKTP